MSAAPGRSRLTRVQWLVCITAAVGFAFDTYELLMLPLIVRPALEELVGAKPGTDLFQYWVGMLFFIPAFAGGIFGLLGGWLTDLLGRRLVLTGSIFLYAGAAFVSGYSTSVEMLLFCRCLVFIGVCVEFVAAIAWLSELFDDPHQRESAIGYTQAFASIGGLMVAFANGYLAYLATKGQLPNVPLLGFAGSLFGELKDPDAAWRFTLMSGLIPAIPLLFVRPFLPESPKWKEKKAAGTLRRPSITELFSPELRRTTIVTTLLVGASYGLAFGGVQMIPQIVPGLVEVKEATKNMEVPKKKAYEQQVAAKYTKIQEVGGLIGRFVLATLALVIISRRFLLLLFALPAFLILTWFFYSMGIGEATEWASIGEYHLTPLTLGVFLAGLVIVGQFSFWGNYLPRVFPLHLRGTGESMAANIGGRMIGTSFAAITAWLATTAIIPGTPGPQKIAYAAALVTGCLATFSLILLWFLPEPPKEQAD